jgi:hypothetical protein
MMYYSVIHVQYAALGKCSNFTGIGQVFWQHYVVISLFSGQSFQADTPQTILGKMCGNAVRTASLWKLKLIKHYTMKMYGGVDV